jgi:hypothetical protein
MAFVTLLGPLPSTPDYCRAARTRSHFHPWLGMPRKSGSPKSLRCTVTKMSTVELVILSGLFMLLAVRIHPCAIPQDYFIRRMS